MFRYGHWCFLLPAAHFFFLDSELLMLPLLCPLSVHAEGGGLTCPSDQGVMGGLVSLPSFIDRFDDPSPPLLGFMVASYGVSLAEINMHMLRQATAQG